MKFKVHLLIIFFVALTQAYGQVVNIESYRSKTDTLGWSGTVGAFGYIRKNQHLIYSIGANFHIDYLKGRNLYLLTNKYNYLQVDDNSYDSNGFLHFRYNYRKNDYLRYEFFLQTQFNTQLYTKSRDLTGIGLRFRLTKSDKTRVFLGTTYMYEYERWADNSNHFVHRSSNYLSFNVQIGKRLQYTGTTYFQPELGDFSNFHVFTDNKLTLRINKKFQVSFGYELLYDTEPPMTAPSTIYYTYNAINYKF